MEETSIETSNPKPKGDLRRSSPSAVSGDGLTGLASLQGALGWQTVSHEKGGMDQVAGVTVDIQEFPGLDHNALLLSRRLHAAVLMAVGGDVSCTLHDAVLYRLVALLCVSPQA